jgi:hypothetical protein
MLAPVFSDWRDSYFVAELRQRQPPVRCAEHLTWIRSHSCCIDGCTRRPVTAHHVRVGTNGGAGMKPSDLWCVPLCNQHHAEHHRIGWQTFEAKYDIDLRYLASHLAATSPYRPKS